MEIPAEADERFMARYYSLTLEDLILINKHRGRVNRLGFALQLCFLRYPGRALQPNEEIPPSLVEYVAAQLQVPPSAILDYARDRPATRREHLAELIKSYNFQPFDPKLHDEQLQQWLMPTALSTANSLALMSALLQELRQRKIIVPTFYLLEKLVWEVRQSAHKQIVSLLTDKLTPQHHSRLDGLLQTTQDKRQTDLAWLRRPTGKTSPANFKKLAQRLEFVRALELDLSLTRQLHQNRLIQLAREGQRSSTERLAEMESTERYAILVAFLLELTLKLTDQALAMHLDLIGQLFNRSERKHLEHWQLNGKVLNEKVQLYAQIGKALIQAREEETDPFAAVEAIMDWTSFILSVVEAAELARPQDFDYLDLMNHYYSWLRQYSRQLLDTFEFKAASTTAGQSLISALKLLKELNQHKGKAAQLPESAPTAFIKPRWHKQVYQPDGKLDRHYYEICALAELRSGLKSGDIWVEHSRQFGNFEQYLLPQAQWQKLHQSKQVPLAINSDYLTYMEGRIVELHEKLWDLNKLISTGQLPQVTIEQGQFHLQNITKAEPEGMETLKEMAYSLLPKVRITDLLVEMDELTGFSRHFTHQQTGEVARDKTALLAAILADGLNLELERMADASAGLSFRQLSWVSDWHIREETYRKAQSELVNFQHKLSFASNWGEGKSSSSDGQRFGVGGIKEPRAKVNLKYGFEPGLMFYTHLSDQYAPYYVQVISTTTRQAPFMINGLLYHESELEITTHHTDTHGYTDQIFGAAHILGYRFEPRIADLGHKRLHCIGEPADYPALQSLFGDKISLRPISASWEELLRLFTSIKKGTVTASLILQKLAAYPRQHRLALALRELGRIEKTLFSVNWIKDEGMRQRGQATLNKGESRNGLARALFYHRLGEVRERRYEDQLNRASGLTLLSAAIVSWNTLYLEKAIAHLREQGLAIRDEQLAHLSPLGWDHLILTGDYIWKLKQGYGLNNLRPLRKSKHH
jgi:TnpA family transposase